MSCPSLISLMVSVDVKHHVYLNSVTSRQACPLSTARCTIYTRARVSKHHYSLAGQRSALSVTTVSYSLTSTRTRGPGLMTVSVPRREKAVRCPRGDFEGLRMESRNQHISATRFTQNLGLSMSASALTFRPQTRPQLTHVPPSNQATAHSRSTLKPGHSSLTFHPQTRPQLTHVPSSNQATAHSRPILKPGHSSLTSHPQTRPQLIHVPSSNQATAHSRPILKPGHSSFTFHPQTRPQLIHVPPSNQATAHSRSTLKPGHSSFTFHPQTRPQLTHVPPSKQATVQ